MINTLAQNGTRDNKDNPHKPVVIITGKGSELGNDKTLKGRAKRKIISQTMALNFIAISDKEEHTEKKKAFWNTYHCQSRIYSFENRYYGKYCKNRFCTLCCSIRKATIINKYLPVICTWEQPYFVTLTIKACPAKRLKVMMNGVIKAFKQIVAKHRKRNQRGESVRLIGIKSLECNFNPVKRTYNPHLHLIVPNKDVADILVNEWMEKWTSKYTRAIAQDKKRVVNPETALIEIIKYGSKIFTEPDVNNKTKAKTAGNIHVKALYNILESMKGLRIFERFGFDLPAVKPEITGARVVAQYYEWLFDARYFDWLNTDNELVLSGYSPNGDLLSLLENNIDKDAE